MIQLLIIFLLILLNGLLAMSEIAIVSARRARLKERMETGRRGAKAALHLAEDPNRFLSTVQIGITLVGILAGAFGGATVGKTFGAWLAETLPVSETYSDLIGIGAVVTLTTYLSLVLGELVPKRLGMEYPEAIAMVVARPMTRISRLMTPIVNVLSFSTNLILRLLQINPNAEPSVTEAEVIHMIEEGAGEGIFDTGEAAMVQGVFQLDELFVRDIMTPRIEIRALRFGDPIDDIKSIMLQSPHSNYPVYESDLDNVIGMLTAKDLLHPLLHGDEINLRQLMRPPQFMPEITVASRALETFKASGSHVALVIDEHGGVDGLITINDILEEIVGDIDADEPEIVQRADGSWLLDGRMAMTRFDEFLPKKLLLPEDEVGSYRTLAGFVMARTARYPRIADQFDYAGLRFEVVDMDGARIDRVLVSEIKED